MSTQQLQSPEFTLEEATAWLSGLSDEARAIIEAAIDMDLDKQLARQSAPADISRPALTH